MDITFVARETDAVALEALEILKQKGVRVNQVSSLPDDLPKEWVVLIGEGFSGHFPSGHLRIKKDEQRVFVRVNAPRRIKNPDGFEIAVVNMAIVFKALPRIEPRKKSNRRRGSPFSRKMRPAGIAGIYPE